MTDGVGEMILCVYEGSRNLFGSNQLTASKQKEVAAVLAMVQQWHLVPQFPAKVFEVGCKTFPAYWSFEYCTQQNDFVVDACEQAEALNRVRFPDFRFAGI